MTNYQTALSDDLFRTAVFNTIEYMVLLLCVQVPLALLIAVGIDSIKNRIARDTVLTLYFMPLVTSTVASAVVFVFLLHPAYGLFNFVLGSLGLPTFAVPAGLQAQRCRPSRSWTSGRRSASR